MYQRHFDIDPLTGAVETFYYDETNGQCMIDRQIDVEPLLELNKAEYNSFDERARWGSVDNDPLHHVARVPMEVLEEFKKQTGINPYQVMSGDDRLRYHKWLDDPSNRLFRTRPGSLSK